MLAEHAPADADAVWVHNAKYDKSLVEELKWGNDGSVRFRGHKVQVTEDLTHLDERKLLEIAEEGISPRNIDGEVIHIHHVGQRADGPLWELGERIHLNTPAIHPLGNKAGVGLTLEECAAFDAWRNSYWQARAGNELRMRGIE